MRIAHHLYAIVLISLLASTSLIGQQTNDLLEIKGSITSEESGERIAQAIISLEGTNLSTVSNLEGKFSLKIPQSAQNKKLNIEGIGYKKRVITLPKNINKSLKIKLKPNVINLEEANLVAYTNAKELVKRVFKNRKYNYLGDKTLMTAFYRETIKKRTKNASLAEAVVNIYKEPYSNSQRDQIRMLKSRKDTDYSKLDTIALKLQGGPFSTLFVDIVKYPENIFGPQVIDAYEFKFDGLTEINGENVFEVTFKQREEVVTPLYQGSLFIGSSSLALVKASYSLKLTNYKKVNEMFVRRKPNDVRIKPRNISYEVNYREKDGKWLYGYSKADLSFEVKKKRKLFKSIYTLSCEMAITDWQIDLGNGSWENDLKINEFIIMADQNTGFNDPDFWGEYNVIEPEKSIESAIRKIQRKLVKDQKNSTGLGRS